MSLLTNYPGLTAALFGGLISLLLIISRIKSARYEQESRAQWTAMNAALQEQQQGIQSLRHQVANLSRFQGKSSKLLLSRIERHAQVLRSCTDELKQASASDLHRCISEVMTETAPELVTRAVAEIKESIQQAGQTSSEALATTGQVLSAEIAGMADITARGAEPLNHQLEALRHQFESMQRQQLEPIQQQISEQSGLSRNQGQQLGKILQAASELSSNQHQAVTTLLNKLETLTERQFASLAEDQAAITQELQQYQSDISDAGIAALQDVAQDIVNQIQNTQSDLLSELKSVQHNIEEAVASAEEELLSESRSLSGAQYQLSDELEQHARSVTDQHHAAIAEASDDIQSQLAHSMQFGLQETTHMLQETIDRVENHLKADNRKLAQALIKIQQQSAQ